MSSNLWDVLGFETRVFGYSPFPTSAQETQVNFVADLKSSSSGA